MFTVGSKNYSRMAYNYLVNNSFDNIDSSNEVLSDENNEKISNELEESIISSIEDLLKKLERTKNLEIPEKLNGKLQSLTSLMGTNYVRPAITTSDSRQYYGLTSELSILFPFTGHIATCLH